MPTYNLGDVYDLIRAPPNYKLHGIGQFDSTERGEALARYRIECNDARWSYVGRLVATIGTIESATTSIMSIAHTGVEPSIIRHRCAVGARSNDLKTITQWVWKNM